MNSNNKMSKLGNNNKPKHFKTERKPERRPFERRERGEVRILDIHKCRSDPLLISRWAQEMEVWACINSQLISDIFTEMGLRKPEEPTKPSCDLSRLKLIG